MSFEENFIIPEKGQESSFKDNFIVSNSKKIEMPTQSDTPERGASLLDRAKRLLTPSPEPEFQGPSPTEMSLAEIDEFDLNELMPRGAKSTLERPEPKKATEISFPGTKATMEIGAALATGALAFIPTALHTAFVALAEGGDERALEIGKKSGEDLAALISYAPKSPKAQEAVEVVGWVIEALLRPARVAGEVVEEGIKKDPVLKAIGLDRFAPWVGYITEFGVELAEFGLLNKAFKRKLKPKEKANIIVEKMKADEAPPREPGEIARDVFPTPEKGTTTVTINGKKVTLKAPVEHRALTANEVTFEAEIEAAKSELRDIRQREALLKAADKPKEKVSAQRLRESKRAVRQETGFKQGDIDRKILKVKEDFAAGRIDEVEMLSVMQQLATFSNKDIVVQGKEVADIKVFQESIKAERQAKEFTEVFEVEKLNHEAELAVMEEYLKGQKSPAMLAKERGVTVEVIETILERDVEFGKQPKQSKGKPIIDEVLKEQGKLFTESELGIEGAREFIRHTERRIAKVQELEARLKEDVKPRPKPKKAAKPTGKLTEKEKIRKELEEAGFAKPEAETAAEIVETPEVRLTPNEVTIGREVRNLISEMRIAKATADKLIQAERPITKKPVTLKGDPNTARKLVASYKKMQAGGPKEKLAFFTLVESIVGKDANAGAALVKRVAQEAGPTKVLENKPFKMKRKDGEVTHEGVIDGQEVSMFRDPESGWWFDSKDVGKQPSKQNPVGFNKAEAIEGMKRKYKRDSIERRPC